LEYDYTKAEERRVVVAYGIEVGSDRGTVTRIYVQYATPRK
jgi:hypothetical protein